MIQQQTHKAQQSQSGTDELYPLYVLVLNRNLPDDTIACVASVQASLLPDASAAMAIVIIDNGSTDHSVALFREYFGNTVTIIELPANWGYAAGMNAGIQYALQCGAQSVLLLNNDTIIEPQMLAHLTGAAALPQAAIVGPVIYYYDEPQRIWRFADCEHHWLPIPLKMSDSHLKHAGSQPFAVDYVTGCAMLVRRAVLETVGLLDAHYFMYFEDADFCRRARDAGFHIYCVPQAKMWHKVSLSARTDKPATRYAQSWGRVHFYRDHPHGVLPGLVVPYLLARVLLTSMRDVLDRNWHLLPPLWQGTWEGYVRNRPSRRFRFSR
jgi:hypothetical protein